MKLQVECDFCGKVFERDACYLKGKKHHFCSRKCLADFSSRTRNPDGYKELKDYRGMSQNMTEINRKLNPTRMDLETRRKLREARLNTGEGKTYEKTYGVHTHRVVAEQILGRPLRKGEVVHHIDGDKRNNSPENLRIFESQAEHARFHKDLDAVLEMLK